MSIIFVFSAAKRKMIKIWDLPSTELDGINYFQNYRTLSLQKAHINRYDVSDFIFKRIKNDDVILKTVIS